MNKFFKPGRLRAFSALLAVLLALPLSGNILTGFYLWLSPYIMLNSVFVLKSFVWLNFVSIPVIIIVIYKKRWFCKNLCPLGYTCDFVSARCSRNASSHKPLPDISRWLAVISLVSALVGIPLFIIIDPMAVFNGFFSVFSGESGVLAIISLLGFPLLLLIHLFLPDIWCTKLCPLGGLQLVLYDLKVKFVRVFTKRKAEESTVDNGRRYFMMSATGLMAGLLIPRVLKPSAESVIRPPASVEPLLFNSLCCRCGSCAKVCPTGIIMPRTDFNNIPGWMTPVVSFKSGYCLETCNLCSQVCPSGAITLFSIKAKGDIFMGTAEVRLDNCLLVNNKECVRCRESCKYEAIEFVARENILDVIPVVSSLKCVGCGACEAVCPATCITVLAQCP
jgi:ferredoxin-type protein NapF